MFRRTHLKRVSSTEFLAHKGSEAIYTQLGVKDMYRLPGVSDFDATHYYHHPDRYESIFQPYTQTAHIMPNGIYWDKRIPVFFTKEEMKRDNFTMVMRKAPVIYSGDCSANSQIYLAEKYYP
ncbi:MAG: hypothetical protein QNJ38_13375 [Prochloraceae cyanobacterium]|nr:hypothetical protein [Prochloraceae cyanobacterium]